MEAFFQLNGWVKHRRLASGRPAPADVRGQAERGLVEEDQTGSAPLGVCRIRGQSSLTQRSIAAWSRSAARRLGRCTLQPSRWRSSAHTYAGWWLDPGQPLDHQRDPLQGPQLPDEPVGAGPLEQGLLDWWRAGRPTAVGAGPLGPRLRRASGPPTCQRACQTLTAWAGDLELAGDLGLAHAGGEQLGGAQPAGLEPIAFLLCRRAARDGWHVADPHSPSSKPPTLVSPPSTRHPGPA